MTKIDFRSELEAVINNSPVVVFLCKAEKDWPVEFVSDNVVNLGYDVEDFESGSINYADIIYPEDLEYVQSKVTANSEKGNKEYT
jgi:hypothetical protein